MSRLNKNHFGKPYCYLTETDAIWAQPLSDVLRDQGIDFITQNLLGAGIAAKVGPILERISFFVAESQLVQAREILDAYFCHGADDEES